VPGKTPPVSSPEDLPRHHPRDPPAEPRFRPSLHGLTMPFLSGRVSFDRFVVSGKAPRQFGEEQLRQLRKHAIAEGNTDSPEAPRVGFLAGRHLFDLEFEPAKNIIAETLHAAIRIDVSRVPAPLRKAWLEIELAALARGSETGRITRTMRQEAREAVQARCEEELKSGRFLRMQQSLFLWDLQSGLVYIGSASNTVQDHLRALFELAFNVRLERLTAGGLAEQLAEQNGWQSGWDGLQPSRLAAPEAVEQFDWLNDRGDCADWLGNEFLLWLWWWLDTRDDVVSLSDGTQVTAMLSRTLSLQCPRGETGKDTISAEIPTALPEAFLAIQSGKLPRRVGLTLVREGETYDLTLQPETMTVGGAAIDPAERPPEGTPLEERIASLRRLTETLDLLFQAFCQQRLTKEWKHQAEAVSEWLAGTGKSRRRRPRG